MWSRARSSAVPAASWSLGLKRTTLNHRMKKLGISRTSPLGAGEGSWLGASKR